MAPDNPLLPAFPHDVAPLPAAAELVNRLQSAEGRLALPAPRQGDACQRTASASCRRGASAGLDSPRDCDSPGTVSVAACVWRGGGLAWALQPPHD
ncbi:hypothetical protein AB1Y20_022956 [Prymnesium parvum]|uniref:Uncharacterized protein n=1 Tax=Prymnesium parvum TaxID=97485 RepID=A0AB34JEQ9_PRYPA